ncbi:BTAD domain-containing putative transcriptional regulator [Meiothermus taiwanensis]|uniref:BTAD domain-containing putative transcriptional regulator n=1 Tax=Meiothermus taiwanensis TaxID=172827 RepID=UPI0007C73232|nr:BTAD domain-containing putative transcriptional regulator [Meiothermus taiwanensis]
MLRLELLGQPRILHAVELRLPRKAVALLAYLAIEGCTPRSRLVDLLWSESDEEGGRRNLRQVLYQLGQTPVQAHLEVGRAQIGLCGFELDVEEFLEGHGCADSLRLWRGEFLQDLELDNASQFEVWLRHQRERLGSAYAKALGHQARELERKGDLRGALEAFQTLIHLDELQEQPHREAMRLYAALGQPEQALCQFKRLTEVLRDELGLEPLPETQALAEQIRQRREVPRAKPLAVNSPSLRAPLVGREQALKRLEAAWQSKNILLIAGQAGVGKSRLVQEFLADKGSYVALSGRPGDAGTPYASMTRWVRQALGAAPGLELRPWVRFEAARLVPELSDEAPPQLDEGGQVRFFQALCELLSQASGGSKIFLSEDEHFADPWSLKALAFGVSQGSRRLVATFRPDEVLPEVAQRYQEWQGSGAAEWLELEPLSEQEVAELVAHLSGRPARLFPQRLYRATSGNPLFVLETLRNLFELGELRQGPGGRLGDPLRRGHAGLRRAADRPQRAPDHPEPPRAPGGFGEALPGGGRADRGGDLQQWYAGRGHRALAMGGLGGPRARERVAADRGRWAGLSLLARTHLEGYRGVPQARPQAAHRRPAGPALRPGRGTSGQGCGLLPAGRDAP